MYFFHAQKCVFHGLDFADFSRVGFLFHGLFLRNFHGKDLVFTGRKPIFFTGYKNFFTGKKKTLWGGVTDPKPAIRPPTPLQCFFFPVKKFL